MLHNHIQIILPHTVAIRVAWAKDEGHPVEKPSGLVVHVIM